MTDIAVKKKQQQKQNRLVSIKNRKASWEFAKKSKDEPQKFWNQDQLSPVCGERKDLFVIQNKVHLSNMVKVVLWLALGLHRPGARGRP